MSIDTEGRRISKAKIPISKKKNNHLNNYGKQWRTLSLKLETSRTTALSSTLAKNRRSNFRFEKCDDEQSVNYITRCQQLYEQFYDSNYDSDSENYVAAISCDSAHQLEPLNAKIQFGEVQVNAMIDSGSVVTLIRKTLANRILRTSPSAKRINIKERRELKTFSNEPIKVLGHREATVSYNNWTCKEARLKIVEDGHKIMIGRDLFNSLGLANVQEQQPETGK